MILTLKSAGALDFLPWLFQMPTTLQIPYEKVLRIGGDICILMSDKRFLMFYGKTIVPTIGAKLAIIASNVNCDSHLRDQKTRNNHLVHMNRSSVKFLGRKSHHFIS